MGVSSKHGKGDVMPQIEQLANTIGRDGRIFWHNRLEALAASMEDGQAKATVSLWVSELSLLLLCDRCGKPCREPKDLNGFVWADDGHYMMPVHERC